MIRTYLIFIVTLFTACNAQKNSVSVLCLDTAAMHNVSKLSSEELYTSKKLDGRTVSIEGFFSYNFEDIALYPNKNNRNEKGIWLVFEDKILQYDSLLTKLNGKKVTVTGTIDLSRKGHLNSYFCTLFNIICLKEN